MKETAHAFAERLRARFPAAVVTVRFARSILVTRASVCTRTRS